MGKCRPLEVVFLTNFSTPCFQVTPIVPQMADDLELNLTILNAFNPEKERRRDVEGKLRSFLPEADGFGSCRRIAMEGAVLEAVEQLAARQPIDLLIAPPSDPLVFPSLQPSLRAAVLARLNTLLWTAPATVQVQKLRSRPRQIACWLELEQEPESSLAALRTAARYADVMEAQLHILYVAPDIVEGALQAPSAPLHVEEVWNTLRKHIPDALARCEVHVSAGGFRPVAELVRRCDADLLLMGREQAMISGFLLPTRMSPVITRLPCPTLCVGAKGEHVPLSRRPRVRPLLSLTA